VEQSGNVRVLTFTADAVHDGEDWIASGLEECTEDFGAGHLLLDFTNVVHLSSVELGRLVTLHKRMKASGGRLTLFNLNARVYEIVTTTQLQTLLGICREGRTNPGGSGSTTINQKKVDETEKTGTSFPGDPDKFIDSE
jgi:anti-anti-sigma factor